MAALSAVVFTLSWWLGLYLLARDPPRPVLVLAATGLTSFALVVALDAVRVTSGADLLSRIEVYLVAVPAIAWCAVSLAHDRGDLPGHARRDARRRGAAVATGTGGGFRHRRDAVLRAEQRDPGDPARAGAELARAGLDGVRRR